MVLVVKNQPANAGRHEFHPWVRKIPWRRTWQPAPGFLPGEFHGQRSLEGYSPQRHKEPDVTERLSAQEEHLRVWFDPWPQPSEVQSPSQVELLVPPTCSSQALLLSVPSAWAACSVQLCLRFLSTHIPSQALPLHPAARAGHQVSALFPRLRIHLSAPHQSSCRDVQLGTSLQLGTLQGSLVRVK